MLDILVSGCLGKMGRVLIDTIERKQNCRVAAGVAREESNEFSFPVYTDINLVGNKVDVIIDFSNPCTLESILAYACTNKIALVLCTTGYSQAQENLIYSKSKEIPVFYSGNMSLGINLLIELSKKTASVLGEDFDIEIIEKHHNQKIDAPSGTAFMIANGISQTKDEKPKYVYDRHSYRKARGKNEIGIHSVRGGNIVGEHEVIFAGTDEIFKMTHIANSKKIFATGAVNAAIYVSEQPAGLYKMSDMLSWC